MMKKLAVVIVLVLAAGGYFFYQKSNNQSTAEKTGSADPTITSVTPTTAASSGSDGKYKDGTYTGDTTDAFYGMMQVQIVVSSGKVTDVKFLQFPDTPGHTTEVSNEALPLLKQEAIQKQATPVDVISGATQDTDAFNQSLASALVKAQ